jgi:hypothetical protein
MQRQRPNLFIDFEEPNSVILTRNNAVSKREWQSIILWWSDGANQNIELEKFIVPFDEFSKKKRMA